MTELQDIIDNPGDPNARMEAYYYGFDRTGVWVIDRILSAVATAGKRAHHTDTWNDPPWHDENGQSITEMIQEAANASAWELREAHEYQLALASPITDDE